MNQMGDTSQNDRVQDGRHLMNAGTFAVASQQAEEDALVSAWRDGTRRLTLRERRRAMAVDYERAFRLAALAEKGYAFPDAWAGWRTEEPPA